VRGNRSHWAMVAMGFHIEQYQSRAEWLAARNRGVGGSESACLFGCGWSSEYVLWAKKIGAFIEPEIDDRFMPTGIGRYLEPAIARMYADATGFDCNNPGDWTICRMAEYPHIFCTPDVIATDPERGDGIVQIKAVSAGGAFMFTNGVPNSYKVQVQHEMMVTGATWGCLVALFGGPSWRFEIFHFEPRPVFWQKLQRRCGEFWERVETLTPPDSDTDEDTIRAMSMVHPGRTSEMVALPDEFDAMDLERSELKAQESRAKKRIQEIDTKIRAVMGDAEFGLIDGVPLYRLSVSENGKSRRLSRVSCSDTKPKREGDGTDSE
jgi:predicted phage-related endonuclease